MDFIILQSHNKIHDTGNFKFTTLDEFYFTTVEKKIVEIQIADVLFRISSMLESLMKFGNVGSDGGSRGVYPLAASLVTLKARW